MRKKIFASVIVAGFSFGVAAGSASADGHLDDEHKVEICHVNGVSDPIPTFFPDSDPRMFYGGKVISVAANSVGAHERQGSSSVFRTDEAGLANVRMSAENNDLRFWEQADCFITRTP